MTYLSVRFSAAFFMSTAWLLGGCCANNVCDCPNEAQQDDIRLQFVTTGARRFTVEDLDTLYIQRYPKRFSAATRPETVVLVRTAALQASNPAVVLNNTTPFTQVGSTKLNSYRYVVQYRASPFTQRVLTQVVVIDSVQLRGSLNANGCCTCYTNSQKMAFVNGNLTPRDLKLNDTLFIRN